MKVVDAFALARTKQQTRRLRRLTVTSLCAVLFAVLLTGSFMVKGMTDATAKLRQYGYNSQYLAVATANNQNVNLGATQKSIQSDMDAELRARKIPVTDAVRQSESYQSELSRRSSVLLARQSKDNAATFVKNASRDYKPVAVYRYEPVESMLNARGLTAANPDPLLQELRTQIEQGSQNSHAVDTWEPPQIMRADQALIQSSLQPGQSFAWQPGQPYPIVVPYASLPKMAGISLEKSTPVEQLATYKKLIRQYTGTTLTYCYRNQAAQAQLTATLQYNKAAASDKDPKTAPLPIDNCRPLDQKTLQAAGIIADPNAATTPKPLFPNTDSAPVTKLVRFRIVGYIPTESFGENQSKLTSIIASVNNWGSLVDPGIMPEQIYEQVPFLGHDTSAISQGATAEETVFFKFADQSSQKHFIDSSCSGVKCMDASAWTISNFGNVIVAFDGAAHITRTILLWATLIVGGIAALLLMSTIGKMITDSRKEIAIFQAVGARPLDIIQIYVSYAALLALNICLGALTISIGLSMGLSHVYSPRIATLFATTFGIFDHPVSVSLFGLEPVWTAVIIGVVIMAAVVGAGLALLSSGRQNVVRSVKDD